MSSLSCVSWWHPQFPGARNSAAKGNARWTCNSTYSFKSSLCFFWFCDVFCAISFCIQHQELLMVLSFKTSTGWVGNDPVQAQVTERDSFPLFQTQEDRIGQVEVERPHKPIPWKKDFKGRILMMAQVQEFCSQLKRNSYGKSNISETFKRDYSAIGGVTERTEKSNLWNCAPPTPLLGYCLLNKHWMLNLRNWLELVFHILLKKNALSL